MYKSLGFLMNTSLPLMIVQVFRYFSLNARGSVARTYSADDIHAISLNVWDEKHTPVIKSLDTLSTEIPNWCDKSRSLRLSHNLIRVKKNWFSGSSFILRLLVIASIH